jgi:hypothetical protein
MVTGHARSMLKNMEAGAARAANAPPEEEPEEQQALEINNPALRQLLKMALTSAEARRWMVQQQPELPWTPFPGGDLIARALGGGIDADRPETIAVWLATLSMEEEMLISAILHENSPPGDADSAMRAAISLQLEHTGGKIAVLKSKQKEPGLPMDQVLVMMGEIQILQKRYLDLQKEWQNIQLDR